MSRKALFTCLLMAVIVMVPTLGAHHESGSVATPAQLVASYDSLADIIIAGKKTEWNLVHAILSSTYSHGQATVGMIRSKLEAGEDASEQIEKLATLVAQIGTEGDSAVNAVRKRLVEAGHHHHASAGDEEIYDTGYVIVTREAKKVFLEAAGSLARMTTSADLAQVEAQWQKVETQFRALHEEATH